MYNGGGSTPSPGLLKFKRGKAKKAKNKKEAIEMAILKAEQLIKSLEKIKLPEITEEKKSYLKGILFKV